MSKLTLDSVEWGEFRIKDLFELHLSKGDNQANLLDEGDIPLVSSGLNINGISKFIKEGDGKSELFAGNVFTVDMFGKASYHEYNFFSVSHGRINILIPKFKMTKFMAIFIVAEIDKNFSNVFSYNRMCSQKRLRSSKILLPMDSNGNPNWQFMEDYIKKEMKKQSQKVIAYYENKLMKLGFELLDLEVEWKEFKIGALFDFQRGNQNNMSKCEDGDIPLISAKKVDNGLKSFIKNNDKKLFSRNIITLNNDGDGGVGIAYYQPYKTALDTHVTALIPREDLSSSNLLYISKVIEKQREKFSHGYSLNNSRLYNQKIMLPIDENGDPYWNYMNNFIKKIKKENVEKILNYLRSYND